MNENIENSFQVLYNYLKNHADWLKVKLGITASASIKKTLLYKMFYIADNEYDQVSHYWH